MPFTFKLSARLSRMRHAAIAAAAITAACTQDSVSPTAPFESQAALQPANMAGSVTVNPGSATGNVGDSAYFTAIVKNYSGKTLTGATITWSSTDSSIVRVQQNGLGKALRPGSARVVAKSGSASGYAQITVLGPVVASVIVTPGYAGGNVGDSAQFSATAFDASGNGITGRAVTWSTTNSAVVTVSASGMGHAMGAGSASLVATIDGVQGQSAITVVGPAAPPPPPPPAPVASVTATPSTSSVPVLGTTQLSATTKDASGNTLTGRAVTWSSGNSAVASIGSSGLVTGLAAGTVTISATSEGVAGTATITVTAPIVTVASVTVTPGSASGSVGDSAQFSATARDASGNAITGRTITWSSSNAAVVAVSATGMGRAVGGGSANLYATIDGVRGSSAITVSGSVPPPPPVPVASVSVSPSNASVPVLGTTQLSVTTKDASGNALTGRAVTWTSSNAFVASVNSNGMVSGLLAGPVTITATSEGASGSANISVTVVAAPPPPPPSASWPNAPSSYALISDQPFSSLPSSSWDLIWNHNGAGSIVPDPNAPFSPGSVLQVQYPAGFAGGEAPATGVIDFASKTHFYMGMWWKPSNPWQGHNSNVNKLAFVYLDPGGGDMAIEMYGPPGGPYTLQVCLQLPTLQCLLKPNVSNMPVTLGQWHRIEWQIEYGTPGQANGIVRWWMDGALVGDYSNIVFPSQGISEFKLSPTWGGMGDVKSQTDYFWFDHVVLKGY